MSAHTPEQWVFYNEKTATYDTGDGTKVAVEVADNVTCFADLLHVAKIREGQRAIAKATEAT